MAAGLAVCVPPHYLWKLAGRRSPWPRLFLRYAAFCAGLRLEVTGTPLRDKVLFASNHVSWLDILVLGGTTGAVFVARDDIQGWPVVGWICHMNDTIHVARAARREVHGQADRLRQALAAGRAVALFPEGTTEGGHEVLPFRPSLFASLFPPLPGVQVQPVAIDYGEEARDLAWTGNEPAGANARRVLSRKGTTPVVLSFLPPVDPQVMGDRKALAAQAQAEVEGVIEGETRASEPGGDPLYAAR